MTRWERFYRWMGGKGPSDSPRDACVYHFQIDWEVFRVLQWLGFLKRDATLPDHESGWYVNFRWQWRFWRGPYYDIMLREGFVGRPLLGPPWMEWRKP